MDSKVDRQTTATSRLPCTLLYIYAECTQISREQSMGPAGLHPVRRHLGGVR